MIKSCSGCILFVVVLLISVSCSNNKKSENIGVIVEDNTQNTDNNLNEDNPADRIDVNININELSIDYNNASLVIDNVQDFNYNAGPQYKMLDSTDKSGYILVYYYSVYCGGAGVHYHLYVIKYDKQNNKLEKVFDSNKINLDYHFDEKTLHIKIEGISEVSVDLTDKLKNLSSEQINDVINGDIEKYISNLYYLGVKDYDQDGQNEMIQSYEIRDTKRGLYLTSLQIVYKIVDGQLKILKVFSSDFNDDVLNDIIDDSYSEKLKHIQDLIDQNVIKERDEKLYLQFE